MNPIFTRIIAETVAVMLTGQHPECRRGQVVPKEESREPVRCGKCGVVLRRGSQGR